MQKFRTNPQRSGAKALAIAWCGGGRVATKKKKMKNERKMLPGIQRCKCISNGKTPDPKSGHDTVPLRRQNFHQFFSEGYYPIFRCASALDYSIHNSPLRMILLEIWGEGGYSYVSVEVDIVAGHAEVAMLDGSAWNRQLELKSLFSQS